MALTSLIKVKKALNIPLTDSNRDNELLSLITVASENIESYCNQSLISQTNTFYLKGSDLPTLVVPAYPCTSLISIFERDKASDTWEEITATLYEEDKVPYLYREDGFDLSYKIQLISGYGTIPGEVTQIANEMVSIMFKESDFGEARLGIGSKGESGNGMGINTSYLDLNKRWRITLDKYRIPQI